MPGIAEIIRARDLSREAEAAVLARRALDRLRALGFRAWVVGSLARGAFRQHSDIDILIDAPPERQDAALTVCLAALEGFPSSIVFTSCLPADTLATFMAEASDEPVLRR